MSSVHKIGFGSVSFQAQPVFEIVWAFSTWTGLMIYHFVHDISFDSG